MQVCTEKGPQVKGKRVARSYEIILERTRYEKKRGFAYRWSDCLCTHIWIRAKQFRLSGEENNVALFSFLYIYFLLNAITRLAFINKKRIRKSKQYFSKITSDMLSFLFFQVKTIKYKMLDVLFFRYLVFSYPTLKDVEAGHVAILSNLPFNLVDICLSNNTSNACCFYQLALVMFAKYSSISPSLYITDPRYRSCCFSTCSSY